MNSQHEAFLRAILKEPYEDEPRLVYADWLEEQGDPRGEFIRVQCRLLNDETSEAEQVELQAREAELLAEHEATWRGQLPAIAQETKFYRGFIGHISAKGEDFLQDAAALFAREPIISLHLDDVEQEHIEPLFALEPLRQLIFLSFGGFYMRFQTDEMSLQGTTPIREVGALAIASYPFRRLRELDLNGHDLSAAAVESLAESPHLGTLEELHLNYNDSGVAGAEAIAQSHHLTNLKKLSMAANEIGLEGAAHLAASKNFQNLESLDLHGNGDASYGPRLGDEGLTNLLANPEAFPKLRELKVWNNDITDASMEAFAASSVFAQLEELELGPNEILADGLATLLSAKNQLQRLDLRYMHLGLDELAYHLARAATLQDLRELQLEGQPAHDGGAELLLNSPHLANLETLEIDTENLSPEVRQRLEARFPDLRQAEEETDVEEETE